MKRIVVVAALLLAAAVPVAIRCHAAGLEDAEFRIGLNPTLGVGDSGSTFEVWTFGWTSEAGAPLLMFEFGLAFINRLAITITSSMSGDEPFVSLSKFLSIYVSVGTAKSQPRDSYDWFGEIGLVFTLRDGVSVAIGYGSSEWLNVGVGFTATLEDILDFIAANAHRRLG